MKENIVGNLFRLFFSAVFSVVVGLVLFVWLYAENSHVSDTRFETFLYQYANTPMDKAEIVAKGLRAAKYRYYFAAKLEEKGFFGYSLSMDLGNNVKVSVDGILPVHYGYMGTKRNDIVYGTIGLRDIACANYKDDVCVNVVVNAAGMNIKENIGDEDIKNKKDIATLIDYIKLDDSATHQAHVKDTFADDVFTAEGIYLYSWEFHHIVAIDVADDKKQCLLVAPVYRHNVLNSGLSKGDKLRIDFTYHVSESYVPIYSVDEMYFDGGDCVFGRNGLIEKIN